MTLFHGSPLPLHTLVWKTRLYVLDLSILVGLLLTTALPQQELIFKKISSKFFFPVSTCFAKGLCIIVSPIKRWSIFPHFLTLGCPCDLLWLTECTGSGTVSIPRPGVPLFSLLEPCHRHVDKARLACWRTRDYLEGSPAVTARATLNQSAAS